jgi:hypothetical protein
MSIFTPLAPFFCLDVCLFYIHFTLLATIFPYSFLVLTFLSYFPSFLSLFSISPYTAKKLMESYSAMEVFLCIERKFPLYGRGANIPCIQGNNHINTSCNFHILWYHYFLLTSVDPWNDFLGCME